MILLGSTGSIGTNTLEVAQTFNYEVESLCAGKNIALLNKQIDIFKPKNVCIADKADSHKLIAGDYRLFFGESGILELIEHSKSPLVVNALVGFAGLKPSLKALECGKKLALANKESLVNAGWLFRNANLTPIDSEHFSLWYLSHTRPIAKLYITASGGAFRDYPLDSIPTASIADALKHPNWQMGHKITIDSATMANKLFEILEARWLFDTNDINAFIESSSTAHALVGFKDGSLTMHLSHPDMKLPIAYALDSTLAPLTPFVPELDPLSLHLEFKPICEKRYPLWALKSEILSTPQKGIILNASNEVAVSAFLQNKINFGKISELVLKLMNDFAGFDFTSLTDIESISALDSKVRVKSQEWINKNT